MVQKTSIRAATVTLWFLLGTWARAQTTTPTAAPSGAGDSSTAAAVSDGDGSRFALHSQATWVEQLTAPFHAPYSGPNSLSPRRGAETLDLTLFLGARLWSGAEAWFNPEIDQGFGLDDSVGLAGFPSGAAYKVGRSHPYLKLTRLMLRQTIPLGGETSALEADQNQFAGQQSANRWVFTVGKFSVPDIFDGNDYAHDTRHDFMNWTVLDAGSFDYAADAWGYTVGASAEWYQGPWTLRAGIFELSKIPNGEVLDSGLHQFQWLGELERRYQWGERAGRLLLTAFDSRGRMARLDDALALAQSTDLPLNDALVDSRQYRSRTGLSLSAQQELTAGVGVFVRAGKASGSVEAYEFTDVDQSVAAGLSVQGGRWSRAQDTVGLAGVINSISAARERYLAAGGLGILVGDGQLPRPRPEQIIETYYELGVAPWAQITLDFQFAMNPAYNPDRGPVPIVALRVHAQL